MNRNKLLIISPICFRLEGKKVKKAREIGKPIVNVQWLNELLFGHFTCLQQPDNPKYQQYNLNNPFKIDYTLVIHLMGKRSYYVNIKLF